MVEKENDDLCISQNKDLFEDPAFIEMGKRLELKRREFQAEEDIANEYATQQILR